MKKILCACVSEREREREILWWEKRFNWKQGEAERKARRRSFLCPEKFLFYNYAHILTHIQSVENMWP